MNLLTTDKKYSLELTQSDALRLISELTVGLHQLQTTKTHFFCSALPMTAEHDGEFTPSSLGLLIHPND